MAAKPEWPFVDSHFNEECTRLEQRLREGDPASPQLQQDMLDMTLRQLRGECLFGARKLRLRAIDWKTAQAFVAEHHRTHGQRLPRGWKFGMAAEDRLGLVGVIMVGRPEARALQDGQTLEVTRLCTLKGAGNACSMLLANAARAAKAMGYARLYTYTAEEQDGSSHKAAGFERDTRIWSRRDEEWKLRWIWHL